MEELLNKLIEKGWDVFPDTKFFWNKDKLRFSTFSKWKKRIWFWNDDYTYRELVSKESWLWQFVCENGMTMKMEKNHRWIWINSWAKSAYQSYPVYTMERYEYRLIESSLCDEDKLEEFLLNSIKLD